MPESSREKRGIRLLVTVAVLVFAFWLLPQLIDVELDWDAITSLTAGQVFVLFMLTMLRIPTEALTYLAIPPGVVIGGVCPQLHLSGVRSPFPR